MIYKNQPAVYTLGSEIDVSTSEVPVITLTNLVPGKYLLDFQTVVENIESEDYDTSYILIVCKLNGIIQEVVAEGSRSFGSSSISYSHLSLLGVPIIISSISDNIVITARVQTYVVPTVWQIKSDDNSTRCILTPLFDGKVVNF